MLVFFALIKNKFATHFLYYFAQAQKRMSTSRKRATTATDDEESEDEGNGEQEKRAQLTSGSDESNNSTNGEEKQERTVQNSSNENRRETRVLQRQKLQVPKKPKIGFQYGHEPDKILGACNVVGLKFLIQWKGIAKPTLVSAAIANVECPKVVIAFYESRLYQDGKLVRLP